MRPVWEIKNRRKAGDVALWEGSVSILHSGTKEDSYKSTWREICSITGTYEDETYKISIAWKSGENLHVIQIGGEY